MQYTCIQTQYYCDFCAATKIEAFNAASFGKLIRSVFPTLQVWYGMVWYGIILADSPQHIRPLTHSLTHLCRRVALVFGVIANIITTALLCETPPR